MNRCRARASSLAFVLALTAMSAAPPAARAQAAPSLSTQTFWLAGARLAFDRPTPLGGDVAVSIHDAGLSRLLARVGATLAFAPQQRYVVVTTSDRRSITFTIGDPRFLVSGIAERAAFAPFFDGPDIIVPLYALARALGLEPETAGSETVFEPQISGLDVRPDGRRTIVTLRGATPLRFVKRYESPERVQLAFAGTGSTLAPARRIGGGLDEVDVTVTGSIKDPTATITFQAPRGSQHAILTSASPYELTLVFAPNGVALDPHGATPEPVAIVTPPASAMPTPPPLVEPTPESAPPATPAANVPSAPSGPATVTNVAIEPAGDGLTVKLALSGGATYEWHRLLDQRWYIDIRNATLTGTGRDERPNLPAVAAVRVRQIALPDAPEVPVVRVAFTLIGDRHVEIATDDGSVTLTVTSAPETLATRIGSGAIASSGPPVADPYLPVSPSPSPTPGAWKFGQVPSGNRVIVIDPGHGGSDRGTVHNGLVEKDLTFDIAQRLRALLVAQGWIVKFTRDGDIDPVSQSNLDAFAHDGKPRANDRAYLQTRCDVANAINARMFISIHVNYAESSTPHGTTFYYTKPQDLALAQALERSVIPAAATKDDGVVHNDFYVTVHTTMPAVLIETAFISNPGDVALLANPDWLQNMAAGIAAGVRAYAGAQPALSSKADR